MLCCLHNHLPAGAGPRSPFSQVCFGEGGEVCVVSVCRFHSLMVHQHLLGRGWLCSAGRCSWDSPAVSVARPLGMGTWICDCTGGYISCGNCFPPLQGWLIRKLKGPELLQACMGMSGSFSDAPEHPPLPGGIQVDQLPQVGSRWVSSPRWISSSRPALSGRVCAGAECAAG